MEEQLFDICVRCGKKIFIPNETHRGKYAFCSKCWYKVFLVFKD